MYLFYVSISLLLFVFLSCFFNLYFRRILLLVAIFYLHFPSWWACTIKANDETGSMRTIGKRFKKPLNFVQKAGGLNSLDIKNTNLSSIDGTSICESRPLEQLFAEFNSLTKLSSGFLSQCENLIILRLENNKISEIATDAFIGLLNLKVLDLSSNQIEFLDRNVFKPLKNLITLYLESNQIQMIDSVLFQHNRKLISLNLHDNCIIDFPHGSLLMQQNLKFLYIRNNQNLSSIGTEYLDSLINLDVVNTSLTTLFLPSTLEWVDARNSQISGIFVRSNSQLERLHLENNRISDFRFINGTLNKLKYLNLVQNSIQLDDISILEIKTKFPEISVITISHNGIDDEEAQRMILEAEKNQIDLAITHNSMHNETNLYFNRFEHYVIFSKLYTTTSLKQFFSIHIGKYGFDQE